jgi:hypothetical protein
LESTKLFIGKCLEYVLHSVKSQLTAYILAGLVLLVLKTIDTKDRDGMAASALSLLLPPSPCHGGILHSSIPSEALVIDSREDHANLAVI